MICARRTTKKTLFSKNFYLPVSDEDNSRWGQVKTLNWRRAKTTLPKTDTQPKKFFCILLFFRFKMLFENIALVYVIFLSWQCWKRARTPLARLQKPVWILWAVDKIKRVGFWKKWYFLKIYLCFVIHSSEHVNFICGWIYNFWNGFYLQWASAKMAGYKEKRV